ncbi:MAG TPA: DMT family transporter [Solirubrobacteraceae bacterium]|jgi:drug/metabolite transporter (DMT)-like permease|nr:DMT family transporter [Solirubrobacteraceae bacterium]
MAAIALALASSVLWGIADFLGGVKSRSFPVPVVLACMYLTSLTVLAVFVGVRGEGPPGSDAVAAGLGSGMCGIVALIAFYRALAIGTMSIVAPVASTGVALPVIVGLATGDEPGLARSIGLAAAIAGVLLASRQVADVPGDRQLQRQSVVLAIIAGLGFGMYLVLSEVAARGDIGWALLLSRITAAPFVAALALLAVRRGGRAVRGRELFVIAGIGLLDLAANALYNTATTLGDLSTVAVASSLYPVTTVLLAAALLGERVRGTQRIGVVLALCGVVLISAGT